MVKDCEINQIDFEPQPCVNKNREKILAWQLAKSGIRGPIQTECCVDIAPL